MSDRKVLVSVDLLMRTDSFLSLLWYRPSTPHDTDLQIDVPNTIAELRKAYTDPVVVQPVSPSQEDR